MLSFRNVNKTEHGYEILAEHVKGEGTYGNARWVPVHPDGTAAFEKYLEARRIRLGRAGKSEDALFPPIKHNGGYISYGRIRTLKSMVEDDLEMKFDYRKCRPLSVRGRSTRARACTTYPWSWGMRPPLRLRRITATRTSTTRPATCRNSGPAKGQ